MSGFVQEKKIPKKIAELSIATISDIADIDKCNRTMLKENYDPSFYAAIFNSKLSCSFVIRVGEKPLQEESEKTPQEELKLSQEELKKSQEEAETDSVKVSQQPLKDSQFAGYVLATLNRDNKGRTTCHIVSLAIYPEFQRQGFANVLMQSVESFLQERFSSVHHLVLHVRKHNKAAYNLYTKLQYNRSKVVKNYYRNPKEDGYEMIKGLDFVAKNE